jgi:hypothetical protein
VTLPDVGPALVLALAVGVLHTCLYVLLRGVAGLRILFILAAAVLGALAGQALGARLGDPLRLGDFALIWASLLAWAGIAIVAVTTTLWPSAPGRQGTER